VGEVMELPLAELEGWIAYFEIKRDMKDG